MKTARPHLRPLTRGVKAAFKACRSLTAAHYENFPVASLWVPSELRNPIAAVYAFARTADDFADEPGMELKERLARLADWRRRLHECESDPQDHPVFVALAETLRRFDLPLAPFDRLITAFERDVVLSRHPTYADLMYYCRHSANPVGEIVLRLHRAWSPERGALSDALCTGLQQANFWQDVAVDALKDRVYVPLEDINARGLSEKEILTGPATPALRELIAFQVRRTRKLFETGLPLLSQVPRSLRRELRFVWLGGTEILRKIEQQRFDVWQRRPKLSRWDWVKLGMRYLTGAPSR